MKIRADFVTNSSSSSFVAVTIKLKNNEDVEMEFEETGEWDDRYLPDFVNGKQLKGKERSGTEEISTLSELVFRLIRCTDNCDGELIPLELYPLLLATYAEHERAEELYEKLEELDWLDEDEYDEYDEDFFDWVREDFLPYKTDLVLDAMKVIDDLSDVEAIHVFRQDWARDSEMDITYGDEESWEFQDDSHAVRELEYDYLLDTDNQTASVDCEKTLLNIDDAWFRGKKFVTTGLSASDERWVKEVVEARGGEYKPKFVVSLNCLVYNPDYDHETIKLMKAKEQIEKGKTVEIITFEEFKTLV